MNELKSIIADMKSVFAQSIYPESFLETYVQMECLAKHTGRETFLVQRKNDGGTAVATCYERSVFPLRPDLQLLQDLNHPGLPRYYEQFENEQIICIVREYIEGEPLSVYACNRQLTIAEILSMSDQLCDILQVLHTHKPPVVHRDIKPENIIVKPDGKITLIDFDIARTVKENANTDTVRFGTKGYAPPEQYGFGQTDSRADIYAFGVLLRWLVTGNIRANGNISIDEKLQRIIDRCTAFAPEQRYQDIAQVRRELREVGRHRYHFRPAAVIMAAVAMILMLGAGFVAGRYTDWLRPTERFVFREPLIEQAARLRIGKEKGLLTAEDLARVDQLFIYGTEAFGDPDPFYRCSVDASTKGTIRTLDDLSLLPNLEEVHIIHQDYVDMTGVAGMKNLRTLELKHMKLSNIAAIADVQTLQHAILFGDNLYDITVLENCPWLETLDIGYNNLLTLTKVGSYPNVTSLGLMWFHLNDVDDIAERFPKVQSVMLQHGVFGDLSGLKKLPDLRNIYVLQEQEDEVRSLFAGTDVQIHITEN